MSTVITIPKYVEKIMANLESCGFEVFAVGGCIRDSLLGKTPSDWDLCTNASPSEVISAFDEYKLILTGMKHGTVAVKTGKNIVEITTYRTDGGYSDGRHPENVKFIGTIEEDLKRRDFTVNAIAYNRRKGIKDIFDGVDDLSIGVIRCVGKPEERFKEDALRIMRAIRFSAVLGFDIDEKTKKAVFEYKYLLSRISKERLMSELDKIMLSDNAEKSLDTYKDIFEFIFKMCINTDDIHTIKSLPKDISIRIAAIFRSSDNNKVLKILKDMKMSKKRYKDIETYLSVKNLSPVANKVFCKNFLRKYGADKADMCFDFMISDDRGDVSAWKACKKICKDIIESGECFSLSELNVDGKDILKLGFDGRDIGKILRIILDDVIEERVENSKDAILEYIKAYKN